MRILLVEDHAELSRWIAKALQDARLSVECAMNGADADALLHTQEYALVILDLTLPKMTGEDVVRWIRQSHTPWADIPILGMVDEELEPKVGRLTSMGMTDWIGKPLDRQQLTEKIVMLMPALYDAGL